MSRNRTARIALAGQPNCGKSTLFNALTGANQRVANWPGVTVDKLSGWTRISDKKVEIIDLPGTYSLTSSSPEERVTRGYLLHDKPDLVVNVVDASNLRQGLSLTLQLLEMGLPLIVNLNMMDAAEKTGIKITISTLERLLQVPVIPSTMHRSQGKQELLHAIGDRLLEPPQQTPCKIDYGAMESYLQEMESRLAGHITGSVSLALRWASVKLLEGDDHIRTQLLETVENASYLITFANELRYRYEEQHRYAPELHTSKSRHQQVGRIVHVATSRPVIKTLLSEKIDRVVCNRFAGPLILLGIMYLLYYCSIVLGYKVTEYTWPLLAKLHTWVEEVSPAPGFLEIPLLRAYPLWLTDSLTALLNYLPVFFILFLMIALLEDSGYMPRMAFITDRVLNRFGLHGQSILPMVLSGVYVGGCAVPGVMSCKGIPDEQSRMATILTLPLLNCQAKVPLYILLVNAYFTQQKGLAMFFISTISLLLVLPVAKLLTLTLLKNKETAPFVMEMPSYHLPTLRGVMGKALERIWQYLRKITTIVAAVASIIFVLLQFPGLSTERQAHYAGEQQRLLDQYRKATTGTVYQQYGNSDRAIMPLVLYQDAYKKAKQGASGDAATAAVNARFQREQPLFYTLVHPGETPDATRANRALRKLTHGRELLLLEMRRERLEGSLLGKAGKALEPVSQWAGFDWRVNVALLSSLAAKENSVATLGALYEQTGTGSEASLEDRISGQNTGFTSLHALTLMLFMVLYPPCIATSVAVKVQTGSYRWMLISIAYPILLGFGVAALVFSVAQAVEVTGLQAMYGFYALAFIITLATGLIKRKHKNNVELPPEQNMATVCSEART